IVLGIKVENDGLALEGGEARLAAAVGRQSKIRRRVANVQITHVALVSSHCGFNARPVTATPPPRLTRCASPFKRRSASRRCMIAASEAARTASFAARESTEDGPHLVGWFEVGSR